MTAVEFGERIYRRYIWTVPGHGNASAVVGDVRDAIEMATARYADLTGRGTSFDDWLQVSWGDDELTFWFELDEAAQNSTRHRRDQLSSLVSILREGNDRGSRIDAQQLIEQLNAIIRNEVSE